MTQFEKLTRNEIGPFGQFEENLQVPSLTINTNSNNNLPKDTTCSAKVTKSRVNSFIATFWHLFAILLIACSASVSAQNCPDFEPVGLSLSAGNQVLAGASLQPRLSVGVVNSGIANSYDISVEFYAVADTSDFSTAVALEGGRESVYVTNSGTIIPVTITNPQIWPASWPEGTAFLGVKVDVDNIFSECIEQNNVSFIPVIVTPPGGNELFTTTIRYDVGQTYPAFLAGSNYDGIGMRFQNPSPLHDGTIDAVNIHLMKEAGIEFPDTGFLWVSIYLTDTTGLPTTLIHQETVTAQEIGAGWSPESTDKILVVNLNSNRAAVTIPLNEKFAVVARASDDIQGMLNVAASNRFYDPDEDEGLCTSIMQIMANNEMFVPQPGIMVSNVSRGDTYTSVSNLLDLTVTFTSVAPLYEKVFWSIDFEYEDHYVYGWELPNDIEIQLNPFWINSIVDGRQIEEVEVVVEGYSTFFTRDDFGSGATLSFTDISMSLSDTGRHIFKVYVNGTEYYRTCYWVETKPFMDAPWANVNSSFIDMSNPNGRWEINGEIPPIDIGFDAPVNLFGRTFDNTLDLTVAVDQTFYTDGTNEIIISDNTLELVVMGVPIFSEDIGNLDAYETTNAFGERYFVFEIDPAWTKDLGDNKIFDGTVFAWTPIPLVLSIKIDAELGIKADMQATAALYTQTAASDRFGELVLTPSVTPYAGLEAKCTLLLGLASVAAGGTAEFRMEFPVTLTIDDNMNPDISVGTCFDLDITYYYKVKVFGATVYQGDGRMDLWESGGCSSRGGISGGRGAGSDTNNQSWAYEYYSSPALAWSNDGSTGLAIWIQTEGNHNAVGFRSVTLPHHDGFSEPQIAINTDTYKSDIDLTAYNNGFAAVWVENHSEMDTAGYTEANLYEALNGQDIVVASVDGSDFLTWSSPLNLTSDDLGDGDPCIAAKDSNLIVVWVKDTNPNSTSLVDLSLWTCAYDGLGWSAPVQIPGQQGYCSQPTITHDTEFENFQLAWVEDLDGDPYTPDDRHLKRCRLNADGSFVLGSIEVVPTAIGPNAPSIATNGKSTMVAYESWGYQADSSGAMVVPVVVGDKIRIFASAQDSLGNWTVRPVGDSLTGCGMNPAVVDGADFDDWRIIYRSFEKNENSLQDGEITYCELESGLNGLDITYLSRKTQDTLKTYMGDLAIDGFGRTHIFYLSEDYSGMTSVPGTTTVDNLVITTPNASPGSGQLFEFDNAYSTVEFANVSQAGYVGAFISHNGPALPAGYSGAVSDNGGYINIYGDLGFDQALITVDYSSFTFDGDASELLILHHNGTVWEELETAGDDAQMTVFAWTTSFSPFVLAVPSETCCVGDRGNVDGDPDDNTDISDLTYMVDFMFRGGADPVCMEEADINSDGENDISDLTAFVDFMFRGGPAPSSCSAASVSPTRKVSNTVELGVVRKSDRTILMLKSSDDIKGIQIELVSSDWQEITSSLDNSLEVLIDWESDPVRIGILDLEGLEVIKAGETELITIFGNVQSVTAVISDMNHQSWYLPIPELRKEQEAMPDDYEMGQNYPNPYNPTTTIGFSLPKAGRVTLEVFNVTGQRVKTLVDTELSAGHHEIQWDSRNNNGNKVSSGVYFYRITADDFHETKKMLLLK